VIVAVLGVLVLAALAAWVTAVISAIAIIQLAPTGERISSLFRLGWLQFNKLDMKLGPAAQPHLSRYRTAIFVFLGCVIALAAVSILLAAERTN